LVRRWEHKRLDLQTIPAIHDASFHYSTLSSSTLSQRQSIETAVIVQKSFSCGRTDNLTAMQPKPQAILISENHMI
jgi:uncharacterized protein YbbK (DUF523 family)